MMDIRCTISWLLAVATLTLSHVTAIVCSADEADDASWSSIAQHDFETEIPNSVKSFFPFNLPYVINQ